jgi:uncharacterized protein YciI
MSMFLVLRHQAGPAWRPSRPLEEQSKWREHAAFMDALVDSGVIVLGGPVSDDGRVMLVVEAESAEAAEAALAPDPWTGSHLVPGWIEPWTIRLDGRSIRPTR